MSEELPPPRADRFPELRPEGEWVREIPAGTLLSRIYKAGGPHPVDWHEFREYGPLDSRFDPHPEPTGEHPGEGVYYAVLEPQGEPAFPAAAFAACLLEAFQGTRMVQRSEGAPTLVMFESARPLRLLDLSDSDWLAVAGGNAAISSGERSRARAWARAIRGAYPELDGVVSASSVVPPVRVAALWSPARDALPRHPLARLRLDRDELTSLIDAAADRYGYLVL